MTTRQREVLNYIRAYVETWELFPRYIDLQLEFGWKSTNSATTILKALERQGFLVKAWKSYRLADTCPCCGGGLAA